MKALAAFFICLLLTLNSHSQNEEEEKWNYGISVHSVNIASLSVATNFSMNYKDHHFSTGPNFPVLNSISPQRYSWDLQYYYLIGNAGNTFNYFIGANVFTESYKTSNRYMDFSNDIEAEKFKQNPEMTHLGGMAFQGLAIKPTPDLHIRMGAGYGYTRVFAPYSNGNNGDHGFFFPKIGINYHFIQRNE